MKPNISLCIGEIHAGDDTDQALPLLKVQAILNLKLLPQHNSYQLIQNRTPATPEVRLPSWPGHQHIITHDHKGQPLGLIPAKELLHHLRQDILVKSSRMLAVAIATITTMLTAAPTDSKLMAVAFAL